MVDRYVTQFLSSPVDIFSNCLFFSTTVIMSFFMFQAGMFEKLRAQIASERKSRLSDMSTLENEISEMEAELRVGEQELEELDLDTDSDSDSSFDESH